MIKYGVHPRTGNLIKVGKRISASPPLFRVTVTAEDRIYETNYLKDKIERKFDPLGVRKYTMLARERRQLRLF